MTLHQLLPILEVGPLCARAHAHVLYCRPALRAVQMQSAATIGQAPG